MCLTPYTLKNKNQTITNPDFTNVVPCGKCPECLTSRVNAWAFRMNQELKRSTSATFLTLTYNDQHLPWTLNGNPTLQKKDFQDFMKRLRFDIMKKDFKKGINRETYQDKHGKKKERWTRKIKYYTCGEYGTESKRPHYHAIMFNLPKKYTLYNTPIQNSWKNGEIHQGDCNAATIRYTLNYLEKGPWEPINDIDDRNKEFSLMSKNMGNNFLTPQMERHLIQHERNYVIMPNGIKQAMPKYYKDQLYDDYAKQRIREENKLLLQDKEKFNSENHKLIWTQAEIRKHQKKLNQERNTL